MGSMWSRLRIDPEDIRIPNKITDIPETSPYYFIAKDSSGNILSEGELAMFKIKLPDKYLYSEFKSIVYDKSNMTAIVQF